MVKVKFGKEQYEAMKKFEAQHHPDIWKWIMDKVGRSENLEILDVSDEACVFALSLAENHPSNKLTISARGDKPSFDLPSNTTFKRVDFKKNYDDISKLGVYDFIIVNEITHEVPDLVVFFNNLKNHLKPGAPLVILSRPKNPPLPIPEVCLMLWNRLAPTRDAIMQAAQSAQMNSTCFSAAVPVSVDKLEWEKILCSGSIPAVRNTIKCGEREIRDFCNAKGKKIEFEEKLTIVLLKNP